MINQNFLLQDSNTYYQVQWAPTWEPLSNLIGCEQLIKEFWKQKSCNSLGVTNVKVKHEVSFCQIIKTRSLDIVPIPFNIVNI